MIKRPDFLKKKETKKSEIPQQELECLNCGTNFIGHYCPNCGQAVKEFDKPFSFVFYNFVGDFFTFDTRFLNTFLQLVFHPGMLTSDFFAGKRARYAPPLRIFIFMSFLLFLLLQVYTSQELRKVLEKSPTNLEINLTDSIKGDIVASNSSLATSDENDTKFMQSESSRQVLTKIADKIENELELETNPRKKASKREAISLLRSPEQAVSKALKLISWAFFILLPIFALLLKLVFIRKNHNYIRHFIFSIHFHSFLFFDFIIVILLELIFDWFPGWLVMVAILLIPFYFIIALKNFYRQNLIIIALKSFVVTILYNVIFWFAITGVVYLMVS